MQKLCEVVGGCNVKCKISGVQALIRPWTHRSLRLRFVQGTLSQRVRVHQMDFMCSKEFLQAEQ